MATADSLTAVRLREVLSYDPDTGVFTWRVSRGTAKAGSVAGSPDKDGYVIIGLYGRLYKAHRLALFHAYGSMPGTPELAHAAYLAAKALHHPFQTLVTPAGA